MGSREELRDKDQRQKFLLPLFVARLLAGAHFRACMCISLESPRIRDYSQSMKIGWVWIFSGTVLYVMHIFVNAHTYTGHNVHVN